MVAKSISNNGERKNNSAMGAKTITGEYNYVPTTTMMVDDELLNKTATQVLFEDEECNSHEEDEGEGDVKQTDLDENVPLSGTIAAGDHAKKDFPKNSSSGVLLTDSLANISGGDL